MALRRGFVLALALAPLIAGCGGGPSNASVPSPTPSHPRATSASLLTYAVRGSDIGPGWTDSPTPDGTSLAVDNESHPCHKAYPSDSERYAKNSVTIVNANDPSSLENELVYYLHRGATDALNDVRSVLGTCTSYTQVNSEGATITIDIHESAATSTAIGDDRVVYDRRATLGGHSIYSVVFMVRVGSYVSTIFTVSGDPGEAGRLAGMASVATANRLRTAPS